MLISCGNSKKMVTDVKKVDEKIENSNNARITGTVHVSDSDCMLFIDAQMSKEGSNTIKMYPVNLADKFKVEGMYIKFSYASSRAKQPDGCGDVKVVSVSDVTPLRGK